MVQVARASCSFSMFTSTLSLLVLSRCRFSSRLCRVWEPLPKKMWRKGASFGEMYGERKSYSTCSRGANLGLYSHLPSFFFPNLPHHELPTSDPHPALSHRGSARARPSPDSKHRSQIALTLSKQKRYRSAQCPWLLRKRPIPASTLFLHEERKTSCKYPPS